VQTHRNIAEAGNNQKGQICLLTPMAVSAALFILADSADTKGAPQTRFCVVRRSRVQTARCAPHSSMSSGRENKGCPAGAPLKTRHFRNDCEKGILPVLQTHAPIKPHRPLTQRERRLPVA
jgi:hypothetical protein